MTEKEINLNAAFDIMCNGIQYKPEGCKLTKDFKSKGCGMCGKGMNQECKDY